MSDRFPLYLRKQTLREPLKDPSGRTQNKSARSIIGLNMPGDPRLGRQTPAGLHIGYCSVPSCCFAKVCFATFPYIFEAGLSFGGSALTNVRQCNIGQTN
jgi:hypothetical protein